MLNKEYLEKLEKLEKKIGQKLIELPIKEILEGITNGYSSDEEGNLTGLNLWEAKIGDISFLWNFPHLAHLELGYNKITDLSPLQYLSNLTELSLGSNQIIDLSPLKPLINLTDLRLYNNQITDLSPLQQLINLNSLDLSFNQITNLSPLQQLSNLTTLYLYNNQITNLSPLQQLSNLTELSLGSNQITDLLPLLPLKKLKRLLMNNNKISRLSAEWANRDIEFKWAYDGRNGLYLEGNPLEFPPLEIAKQGDAAIRNYFKEIQEDTVLLLQAKLLLVGAGSVGKTTLIKKLQDPKYQVQVGQESTTRGIEILPWQLDCTFANRDPLPVTIHCWDFGGQDILYATHQFFLTKRSLYLFVWEARQEGQETASFDYWLNIIKLLSDASPVIIVMNKADSRSLSIDEASLQKKFPFIQAFIQVSCLTGKGIADLTELIRATLSAMPHLQDRLPKTWLQIRDDLKALKKDYISRADYMAICAQRGLNRERAEFLSDYLHDLGVILHFRSEPLLAETVILNPEWATTAVYKIIDAPAITDDKGRFKYTDLKTYWEPHIFPEDKHPQLLRLMEKFELCFPVLCSPDNIHIVPELLPATKPSFPEEKYNTLDSLHYQYHYDFMPRGIISRFITRIYYLIAPGESGKEKISAGHHVPGPSWDAVTTPYWKNGVEMALDSNTYALVQSDPLNRQLTVKVWGEDKSELLAIVRHHLGEIHRSLNMVNDDHYREMIPCRCSTCRTAPKPYLFPHQVLKNFAIQGIPSLRCFSTAEVSIMELLKGYAPPSPKTDLSELLPTLIDMAARLQSRANAVKTDEDSRNTIIAEFLGVRGYMVKDQTRRGRSAEGKRAGELDLLVETPDGEAVSIIEAFILKGEHHGVIDNHFKKLFTYDANGLENNYMLIYAENEEFGKLWQEYLNYLPKVEAKFPVQGGPLEEKTPYADIKLARTRHNRHNRETNVYHLFVNMKI